MDLPELIAESLPRTRSEAIIAADRDGIIRFWNPGAERIFGYAAAEAISHSLDLIIPERLRAPTLAGISRHYGDGEEPVRRGRCALCTGNAQKRRYDLDRVHDPTVTRKFRHKFRHKFRRNNRDRGDHARRYDAFRGNPPSEEEIGR